MITRKSSQTTQLTLTAQIAGLGLATALLLCQSTYAAKKFNPSQAPQTTAEEASNFEKCRKEAVGFYSKGQKDRAKRLLTLCDEHFPGAAELKSCKRAALKDFKDDASQLKKAVSACDKSSQKLGFDPNNPLPFTISDQQLYFAGMGLNLPQRLTESQVGNFNCRNVRKYMAGGPGEYLLFGNHPRVFSGFKGKSHNKIMQLIGVKTTGSQAAKSFQMSKAFGQVFDVQNRNMTAAYLPLSFCYFARKTGKNLEGLKVYFLINKAKKMATPYFGIAFYRKNATITYDDLVTKTRTTLGNGYAVQDAKPAYTYIAKAKFTKFDAEGDPYNICATKNQHQFVALVRKRGNSNKPEYMITANVANLCQFGDRLSEQVAGKS